MPFLNFPDVHWISDQLVQLDAPLEYKDAKGRLWVVPVGFISDLESRPTLLPGFIHFLLGDKLETARAALVHDFLYKTGSVSRKEADTIYYEALRDNINIFGSFLGWLGVRVGGWIAWKKHRKAKLDEPTKAI